MSNKRARIMALLMRGPTNWGQVGNRRTRLGDRLRTTQGGGTTQVRSDRAGRHLSSFHNALDTSLPPRTLIVRGIRHPSPRDAGQFAVQVIDVGRLEASALVHLRPGRRHYTAPATARGTQSAAVPPTTPAPRAEGSAVRPAANRPGTASGRRRTGRRRTAATASGEPCERSRSSAACRPPGPGAGRRARRRDRGRAGGRHPSSAARSLRSGHYPDTSAGRPRQIGCERGRGVQFAKSQSLVQFDHVAARGQIGEMESPLP